MAAFEARDFQRDKVRVPRGELRRPHFVVRAAGVRILPCIGDVEWASDHASADFLAKEALQHVFVDWQSIL